VTSVTAERIVHLIYYMILKIIPVREDGLQITVQMIVLLLIKLHFFKTKSNLKNLKLDS